MRATTDLMEVPNIISVPGGWAIWDSDSKSHWCNESCEFVFTYNKVTLLEQAINGLWVGTWERHDQAHGVYAATNPTDVLDWVAKELAYQINGYRYERGLPSLERAA